MTDKPLSLYERIVLWLWSPFVALPVVLLTIVAWPEETPQPPIFDVQVHYNDETWRFYSAEAIAEGLRRHNVPYVLVSSIPNEGTFRLLRHDAGRVIPMFTPYRQRSDRYTWFNDPEIVPFMERELDSWPYRGIGEFHLAEHQVDTPVVRRMVELAAQRGLVLSAHSDAGAISQLFALGPSLRILWCHAGISAGPDTVEAMLYKHPGLWVDLSQRNIAPGGTLDPAWKDLLLRYPERFVVGTGTYTSEAWYYFRYMLRHIRIWLAQLPPEVARLIAHANAERLFLASQPLPPTS